MIKFFRHIRFKLMETGKTAKYFKYAIGEIILVVIGILIALQINNWNQHQKELKKEQQIIASLHLEFNQNKTLIKSRIDAVQNSTDACFQIMEVLLLGESAANAKHIDSLLYWAIEYGPFISNNNTYTEIINTGEIELLRNDDIKNALFEYNRELDNNSTTYKMLEKWIEEGILPYLINTVSIRNIDSYGSIGWEQKSRFDGGFDTLIDDRKFENLIDNNVYHLARIKDEYLKLERITDVIIKQTSK